MELNRTLLRRFKDNRIAIAVRTKSDWHLLMELLEREGDIRWPSTDSSLTSFQEWGEYKEDSAIAFGCYWDFLGYADTGFYKRMGLEIIEFGEMLEEKMSFAEKIEFLNERRQDGKEFLAGEFEFAFLSGHLYEVSGELPFPKNELDSIMKYNLSLIRRFELTEAERVILENIDKSYNYLVRNKSGSLFIHKTKPKKGEEMWLSVESWMQLQPFKHLFTFIKWEDIQSFNIKEYLEEL